MDQVVAILTTLVAAAGLAATVLATNRRTRLELEERIDRVETNLGERIDRVETNLGERIDRLDLRIDRLDDRVYALAAGLSPRLEPTTRDD